jgi:hypothetical protein
MRDRECARAAPLTAFAERSHRTPVQIRRAGIREAAASPDRSVETSARHAASIQPLAGADLPRADRTDATDPRRSIASLAFASSEPRASKDLEFGSDNLRPPEQAPALGYTRKRRDFGGDGLFLPEISGNGRAS